MEFLRGNNMECGKIFEIIDKLNDEYVNFWVEVSNIESPTEYKEGVDAAGLYFADKAKELGFLVETFNHEKAGNVICITMNPESEEKPVTFSAHIDTVHKVGSFGNPPSRIVGDKLFGPGVMDCKGGGVAALMAMDALKHLDFCRRPVMLLLQTDEESNSMLSDKDTINYMLKKAEGSVAFLNCESSRKGTLVLERKGILRYRFDVKGKEIHSSRCKEGLSAIAEAASKILTLEKLKDENGLTCNCGLISGGTAANTVPDQCSFVADIRFSAEKELLWIRNYVKEVAESSYIKGCTCEIEETGFRPAMEKTERNMKLLEQMNEIYKENGLPELTARKSLGGSDAADVTTFGIPCIDSIGVEGDFIHTANEFAYVKSLPEAAKRLASIAYLI